MASAIIPVKRLTKVKGRLSEVLSPLQRRNLFLKMLKNVIEKLVTAPHIDHIFLVTSDLSLMWLVFSNLKVSILEVPDRFSLNEALAIAADYLLSKGEDRILIVPGDLPHLKTNEIEELLDNSKGFNITIIPDKTERGTNGLLLSPPTAIKPAFGENSFQNHISMARYSNLSYQICRLPSLRLDIDMPEDLVYLEPAESVIS